MQTIISIHNESEYREILQQTVAVIEAARFQVARTIATSSNDMHWSIGKILHDRKLEGKHGDGIDLKISEFQAEYVGKMNLYLSLLDKLEKREDENSSIGIILCAEKDNVEVELALDGFTKPIGVADYKLIIPKNELKQLINYEIKSLNQEVSNRQIIDADK